MGFSDSCYNTVRQLYANPTRADVFSMMPYCQRIEDTEVSDKYGKPMVWIGVYIAVATLFCILAMAADLFQGFRNRKFWFPCKYFTLNVASITVIGVAMKLSLDLNNPMQGGADQTAKLGSMAFMCTMMANLMPSLASIDNKELLANVLGLVIFVITLVVNVLIQIQTGLLKQYFADFVIYMYVSMILSLLVILISLSITIPTSKQILEFKYQVAHKRASNNERSQHERKSTVEELTQQVRRYWIMAGTCSPQFVMASTPLCSVAGLVCVSSTTFHFLVLTYLYIGKEYRDYRSDYKGSVLVVLITQSVGVAVGTIAPIFRCFAALSFKLSIKWSRNHIKVFVVEKYWTQKLFEWKQSHLSFPFSGPRSKTLVRNLKNLILSLCIGFQNVVVVSCKIIGLIPIGVVILVVYCFYCWKSLKAMFFPTPIASSRDTVQEDEQNDTSEDISMYVLQLQDEMELAKRTLKTISNSMNRLIKKAEKHQPDNLLKLLETSIGFEGVESYDSDQVQSLLSVELVNTRSLSVVTLICIAISLPNIHKDIVESLLSSVREGLLYACLVEQSLNSNIEYVNIQNAAMTLWHEVEDDNKWLENTLQRNAYKGKTSSEILKWFADRAEEIIVENKSSSGELMKNSSYKLIVANSMYRITHTIMLNNQSKIGEIRKKQLFSMLSGMIADIIAACLTNLPQVIAMKCHESAIEKREASVEVAAKLLGKTKEIIKRLQEREQPSLDFVKMSFIDERRVHFKQSIP